MTLLNLLIQLVLMGFHEFRQPGRAPKTRRVMVNGVYEDMPDDVCMDYVKQVRL